ncbi:ankyrin repeat domain-containing protein [Acinetobacter baumannii]|uniref:ankyrin repeat domain-containing protein n=1 Tax=Acinetobacter baumannii TaxID=470 RepID=UPI0011E71BE4|nr:ankyrin repeat domain-containing protein [Acinetobacter baumannii]QEI75737.1 ankyrin repeat domain-containing protein [Acinetobacter baumannii]
MDELKIIAKDIHSAIRDGNNELAIKLLKNYRHLGILNFKTPFGTWLHDAALHNRKDIIVYLVSAGVDINEQGGPFRGNALSQAVNKENIEIIEYFLNLNMEITTSDSIKNPLFTAIYRGNLDIVKILIEHGVNYTVAYTGEYAENLDVETFAL